MRQHHRGAGANDHRPRAIGAGLATGFLGDQSSGRRAHPEAEGQCASVGWLTRLGEQPPAPARRTRTTQLPGADDEPALGRLTRPLGYPAERQYDRASATRGYEQRESHHGARATRHVRAHTRGRPRQPARRTDPIRLGARREQRPGQHHPTTDELQTKQPTPNTETHNCFPHAPATWVVFECRGAFRALHENLRLCLSSRTPSRAGTSPYHSERQSRPRTVTAPPDTSTPKPQQPATIRTTVPRPVSARSPASEAAPKPPRQLPSGLARG